MLSVLKYVLRNRISIEARSAHTNLECFLLLYLALLLYSILEVSRIDAHLNAFDCNDSMAEKYLKSFKCHCKRTPKRVDTSIRN